MSKPFKGPTWMTCSGSLQAMGTRPWIASGRLARLVRQWRHGPPWPSGPVAVRVCGITRRPARGSDSNGEKNNDLHRD